jgi:replicative DNA helicase
MKRENIPPMDDDIARLRVPPHSIEAEHSVLGSLLIDAAAFDRVGDLLTADSFYRFEHRIVFGAIAELVASNREPDVIAVFERLQVARKDGDAGGIAYLNALAQSVPTAAGARRYAEIVRDKALHRAVIAAADEAAEVSWGNDAPTVKLDSILTVFDKLQRDQVLHKPRAVADLADARLAHYDQLACGQVLPGKPTGLRDLDAALNGGLQDGRVYVLAARPSVGKTALAMQVGLHRASAGDGVLLLSQEMPAEECTDRAIANLGGVDYGRMQRGQMNDIDWSCASAAAEELKRLPLWIDDQPALKLADIRGKAMSLRRQGLRLLIVDYLQLCSGSNPGRGSTRNGELEEICRGLKTLAKQLRLPVLLLSQLSREVEKRSSQEPTLADLRDSGAIEQDADCVLFLWTVRTWSDRRIVGLKVGKNRQGRNDARIPLEFFGDVQRWTDSTADISKSDAKGGFE